MKDLLLEYADSAKYYDVSARALAIARRRRTMLRVAPVTEALVIVSLVAVVWAGLAPTSTSPFDGLAAGSVAGCPTTVQPRSDATALPRDLAVGRSCLTYNLGESTMLVTGDGSQYRLGSVVSGPGSTDQVLSPDGSWLAIGDGAGMTAVRDLLSTKGLTVTGVPLAWSPDSRWLAAGPLPVDDNPGRVTIVEPSTSYRVEVDLTAYSRTRLISVLPTGEPVLAPVDGGDYVELIIVDPATGEQSQHLSIEIGPALAASERPAQGVQPMDFVFTTNGRVLVRQTVVVGPLHLPGDVLVIELRTAEVVQRWPLPGPTAGERWESVRMLPQGLLVERRTPTKRLSLELYDPATGTRSLITDLSSLPGKRP